MRQWRPTDVPANQFPQWVRDQFGKLAQALRTPGPELVTSRTISASSTVTDTDGEIRADATGGAITLTLPPAVQLLGHRIMVIRLNAGANAVTVAASGAETINGAATKVLGAQYATTTLIPVLTGTTYSFDAF